MRRRLVGALVTFPLAALSLSACSAQPTPEDGTATAPSYTYVLESSCGERALLGRYAVTVDDEQVVAVEDLALGTPVPASLMADVPTIDELASRLTTEAPAEVSYEAHTGLLVSVRFDGDLNAIDDEECYAISEYSPT